MDQWDIFQYPFGEPIGAHPVVILTPSEQADNPDIEIVNVLMVVSLRGVRPPKKFEVVLNGADGLDNLSVVRVLPIYQVLKKDLQQKRGAICHNRLRILAAKIREVYRL